MCKFCNIPELVLIKIVNQLDIQEYKVLLESCTQLKNNLNKLYNLNNVYTITETKAEFHKIINNLDTEDFNKLLEYSCSNFGYKFQNLHSINNMCSISDIKVKNLNNLNIDGKYLIDFKDDRLINTNANLLCQLLEKYFEKEVLDDLYIVGEYFTKVQDDLLKKFPRVCKRYLESEIIKIYYHKNEKTCKQIEKFIDNFYYTYTHEVKLIYSKTWGNDYEMYRFQKNGDDIMFELFIIDTSIEDAIEKISIPWFKIFFSYKTKILKVHADYVKYNQENFRKLISVKNLLKKSNEWDEFVNQKIIHCVLKGFLPLDEKYNSLLKTVEDTLIHNTHKPKNYFY